MFSVDDEDGRPVPDEQYRALRTLYVRLRALGFAATFDPNELEHYFEPVIDITVAGLALSIEQHSGADCVHIERRVQSTDQEWPYLVTVAERLDNDMVPALLLGLQHPSLAHAHDIDPRQ
ncbi:transposase [Nocardia sp. GAS34]|uniref:hypothetical protein n=1 Tax=unclassified Nocardia TaxID=2637762 RepID=UPI003D1DA439